MPTLTRTAVLVVGFIVAAAILRPAPTETASPTLTQLGADLAALRTRVTTLEGQVVTLQTSLAAETAARQAAEITLQNNISLEAAARVAEDAGLEEQISNISVPQTLLDLANYVSVDLSTINGLVGPHVIFTGANVHIRNALAFTDTKNGLGNLLVGYNEIQQPYERSGSHNIVVGREHGYSSYGGLVAGTNNRIGDRYASVTGGNGNRAIGDSSSISGGLGNVASNAWAVVSGGGSNTASGLAAAISGGFSNIASGTDASISGGGGNTASGQGASATGGFFNTASGENASVGGGTGVIQNNLNGWSAGAYHTP